MLCRGLKILKENSLCFKNKRKQVMMLRYTRSNLFIVLLILTVLAKETWNASLSVAEQKKYKSLIEGQGLYSTSDDVEILTNHNFKTQIYGKQHAWIVEFYNSWCGFCQRFAPSWKALATDIREWKSMIKVGAVDCSDEDNTPICRDFEIMAYPTLRYFHENYQEGPANLGTEVTKGDDVHSHRRYLLERIIIEQKEGRGKMFPNLIPYSHPNKNYLFDQVPIGTKYVFLVFEKDNSLYGAEVCMDLYSVQKIAVRSVQKNNTELINNLSTKNFPSMVVFGDDETFEKFDPAIYNNRESFTTAIKEFLKPKGLHVPDPTPKNIFTGKWLEAQVPDMTTLMEAREFEALKRRIRLMGDVVFQMDLETALRYSLKHEVGSVKDITDEKLDALRAYLTVLAKYFPFGKKGQVFLQELRDLANSKPLIHGSEVVDAVKNAENSHIVFSSPQQWLACRGSTPGRRGFPCGMWKLFHYLTVNAADQNSSQQSTNPREVLDAMHKYIKNFFGCADCSRHFQEMAKAKDMQGVTSPESAIMWLWMAHNDVNKRLAGDQTEDPEFPKIQFPSKDQCSHCRNSDNTWNYPEVLKYLKSMYSSINVRYIGSDTRILHLGLDGASDGSINFTTNDTSMCFILYLASFVLIVILIRLFLKRGYRKKMYVHDLLGKV